MLLVFRHHKTNHEIYVAPECPHDNYEYANVLLKHFSSYSTGLCTYKELEQFKICVKLHGHELKIIERV